MGCRYNAHQPHQPHHRTTYDFCIPHRVVRLENAHHLTKPLVVRLENAHHPTAPPTYCTIPNRTTLTVAPHHPRFFSLAYLLHFLFNFFVCFYHSIFCIEFFHSIFLVRFFCSIFLFDFLVQYFWVWFFVWFFVRFFCSI